MLLDTPQNLMSRVANLPHSLYKKEKTSKLYRVLLLLDMMVLEALSVMCHLIFLLQFREVDIL